MVIANGYGASLVTQTVKDPSAMQGTHVPSLGWEDPLEKGMAIHSSTLAWRIPWAEEPGRGGWQGTVDGIETVNH